MIPGPLTLSHTTKKIHSAVVLITRRAAAFACHSARRCHVSGRRIAASALAFVAVAIVPAVAGTITDLGTFGGTSSQALGINNSGQVVGWAYTAANAKQHAFLYSN